MYSALLFFRPQREWLSLSCSELKSKILSGNVSTCPPISHALILAHTLLIPSCHCSLHIPAPLFIYCSPYARAKQTLKGIVESLESNPIVGAREEPRITGGQHDGVLTWS